MNEKYNLEVFNLDIDRIASGESIVLSEYQDCDAEYKELLQIAQLLAQADYSRESQRGADKLLTRLMKKGELGDDDLDLVAGGLNPDADPGLKKVEIKD